MKNNKEKKNVLSEKSVVIAGTLLCCLLWGSAFSGIKTGYRLWGIESSDTGSIILFAGARFFLAGLLVIILGSIIRMKRSQADGERYSKILLPRPDELPHILLLSLFQTIGQYVCFYMGLAHTTGVNGAIINSLSNFFAILAACLAFRMEKLTVRKMIGCLLGFAGVLVIYINAFTGAGVIKLNPVGDFLVGMSAVCYAISSVLIKYYSKEHDTVLFSGYQFLIGGAVMMIFGMIMRSVNAGTDAVINSQALETTQTKTEASLLAPILIIVYLAFVSGIAYTLWGLLLKYNDVSKISIYGFMTPVFGVLLSAIILGEWESLGIRYLVALILISVGIVVVNKQECNEEKA